jgi:hypothetical protein
MTIAKYVALAIVLIGDGSAEAAQCAGKTVAECADALAQKIDDLERANTVLEKKIVEQAKEFDDKIAETKKSIAIVDKKTETLSQETAVIRPGGQGCLLVRFNDTPPGYVAESVFALGMEKPGNKYAGSGLIPFFISTDAELNPAFYWTHGWVACAK